MTKKKLYLPSLLISMLLTACGGGSDSTPADEQFAAQGEENDVTLLARSAWRNKSTTTTTTTPATTSPTTTTTTAPSSSSATYERVVEGAKRSFNFDGNVSFMNAATGQSDMHDWLYNARYAQYYEIRNAGVAPWIEKIMDSGVSVTRFQVHPTDAEIYSWRTQASTFPFENYKNYSYQMEFKLDPNWNFNMANGDGLLWQAKGAPKPGQYGHASMSIGITGNNMYFSLLYPNSALRATTWPTNLTWPSNDYVATSFPTRPLVAGRYYKLRVDFFADDRPSKFGGKGYVNIWLDDALWIQYQGPNLHPDQNGPHRWDFGWYNWGGKPSATRAIYFKKSHVYVQ